MSGYIASTTRVILNKITYTNSFLCSVCYHLIWALIITIGSRFLSITAPFPRPISISHYKSECSLNSSYCVKSPRIRWEQRRMRASREFGWACVCLQIQNWGEWGTGIGLCVWDKLELHRKTEKNDSSKNHKKNQREIWVEIYL